jgi:hypothetical protein
MENESSRNKETFVGVHKTGAFEMMKMLSSLMLILVAASGCSATTPKLEPRLASESTPSLVELVSPSNVIVLATVVSETMTGETVTVANNEHVRLQKIDIDVEGVLKGKTDSSKLSFYRYRWYDDWIKQSPTIDPIVAGGRSVFFLNRTADGTLRAAFDVTVSRVPILSGTHDLSSVSGLPIEQQIAYLMLTPGNNASPDDFGQSLAVQALTAMPLIGQTGTLKLLRPLLKNPSEPIRTSACLAMAQFFTGQSECLADLPSGTGEVSSQRLQTLKKENEGRDVLVRKALQKGNAQDLALYGVAQNAGGLCDYLRAMTEHQDPEIARLASGVLEKQFPDSVRSGCPAIF